MAEYPYHEAASVFPLIEGDEYEALKTDIREHGLLNAIELLDDEIIEGRNRYRACSDVGVEPKFVQAILPDGMGPTEYAVSKNVLRRHLRPDQLAMLAQDLRPKLEEEAKARQLAGVAPESGTASENGRQRAPATRERLAETFHVGKDKVDGAKKVYTKSRKIAAKVRSGEMTLAKAMRDLEITTPKPKTEPDPGRTPKAWTGAAEKIAKSAEALRSADQPENAVQGDLDLVVTRARQAIGDLEALIARVNGEGGEQ